MGFKDKNILVTGGCGFVGGHLVEALVEKKANVTVFDEFISPLSYFSSKQLNKKTNLIIADLVNYEKVYDVLTKHNIELIFHLAAQPLVDVAFHNPKRTLESNVMGTVNVLEAVRLFRTIKGIVFASSDKAYGKLQKSKYFEADPLRGDHPYEVSKSAADLIATSYYKTYGIPVVITRFGNIYGEGDLSYSRIIPGIMKSLITNKTLEIRSNGKFVRDYLYVKDVVDGYLMLAKKIDKYKGEAFNFGSDETLTVIEVIKLAEKALNKKISYKIVNNSKNEIPYQSLSYTKIRKALGWKPKYSIKKTARGMWEWYEKVLKV